MRLSDARALLPNLKTEIWSPKAGMVALNILADWCQRYTPTVSVDGEDGLFLDVAGAAHFYGSEAGLLEDLSARLTTLGFSHELGLAETPGAASAMARFASSSILAERIVEEGEIAQQLAALPLAALRLEPATLYLLQRFGLQRLDQLLALPRASLKRRFPSSEISQAVLTRLDQVLGRVADPLTPLRPPPLYSEQMSFAEPITAGESFTHGLTLLLERVCVYLERDLKGATALTFCAYRGDGGVAQSDVVTARPSRDAAHLKRLFAEKLEALDPGFGVDHLRLSVGKVERLDTTQLVLTTPMVQGAEEDALAQLMDRLASRLGPKAVQRIAFRESHMPERAEYRISALSAQRAEQSRRIDKPPRPLRLLVRPEPVEVITEVPEGAPKRFTWRRVAHQVRFAAGPERIAPEWWRHVDLNWQPTRDYYSVEDERGQRFWMYRAGFYGDASHPPSWHMHGLFT